MDECNAHMFPPTAPAPSPAQVDGLSAAYSQWNLDPADRRGPGGAAGAAAGDDSYSGAARLPLGKDLQLTIEALDYRAR